MNNDEFDRNTMDSIHDEEILMRMHLNVKDSVDPKFALSEIIRYTQTFSFTAILPVQPMRYDKTDKGMDVKFLRKKTPEKNSIDGGLQFQVTSIKKSLSKKSIGTSSNDDPEDMIQIQVTRISEGQSITKVFSEKLIVLAYCDGILGKTTSLNSNSGETLTNYVDLWSVFHKWL
jgi:hypothetical protein